MNLISREFLLLFIPLTLAVYYLLAKTPRQKMFLLLAVSYLFYGLAGWKFIPVLMGLSLATFLLAKWDRTTWGVTLNLLALLLFKYWNFGVERLGNILTGLDINPNTWKLALPLGISFFVFKHIGYLLDVRQKRYPASDDVWIFAAFSAYFPQISAGPISSFNDTAGQFERLPKSLNSDQLASGLIAISMGLTKKILIAEPLSELLASSFNTASGFSGFLPSWYLVVAYTIQLYFDFSGYTDLALGISQLFGIRLPQNFNNPYLSTQPAEFWERWHISLSNWFRVYLFSPISRSLLRKWGSQKREQAQYAANMITMSLIGLWHGTGWNYVLWGAYHGVLLNLNVIWKRANRSIHPLLQRLVFLFLVLLGWALFMGRDTPYLLHLFAQLAGLGGLGSKAVLINLLSDESTLALFVGILVAFSGAAEASNLEKKIRGNRIALIALGILAALSILLVRDYLVSRFIYVQF